MSKIPKRVIPRPAKRTHYVRTARGSGSSLMDGASEGNYTYVCGNWRDEQLLDRAAEAKATDV